MSRLGPHDQGDPDAPPVVFVHGAGADHTVWRFQTRWLAGRGRRTIAVDLPGHGHNPDEAPASIEAGAKWLSDVVADLTEPVIVGHSMGALIALEAAASSDRVVRMILVGAGLRMPVHPELIEAARHDLRLAAALIAGWSLPGAHRGAHPEPGTWQSGGIAALVEHSRPGVLASDLEACARYDGTNAARRISVPVTVISGEEDRMVGAAAGRELAEAMPGARHVVIPGTGHDPMVQVPREFNRLLLSDLTDDGKEHDL